MRFSIMFAVVQRARRFRSQPARFHHGEDFQLHHLSDALEIINRRFLQRAVLQPAAGIGMVLMDQDKWMQPSLLATGAKKQGQIKARSEAVLNDVRWEADLLSRILETPGRRHIADSEFRDGFVDRRNLFPRPFAAFVLVAIELRPPGLLTENLRGA